MANKLEITLKRSVIGSNSNQRKTVEALGLKKREHSVIQQDNDAIRGMINKIKHLVEVKEIEA